MVTNTRVMLAPMQGSRLLAAQQFSVSFPSPECQADNFCDDFWKTHLLQFPFGLTVLKRGSMEQVLRGLNCDRFTQVTFQHQQI